MIEVTVYAVIAIFIFFRLYLALGKNMGDESPVGREKMIDILEEKNLTEDSFLSVAKDNFPKMQETIKLIKVGSPSFSTDNFIKGAERAFEAILTAFNEGDIKILRTLLTKEVMNKFSAEIKKREEKGKIHKSIIISISTKEIVGIEIVKDDIFITVKFISEQIHSIIDTINKDIPELNPKKERVEDIWKFTKKTSSSDHKWLLYDAK